MTRNAISFTKIRRDSEMIALQSHEFTNRLRELENFEENVQHLNAKFRDVEPRYIAGDKKTGDYGFEFTKQSNLILPATDRAIAQLFNKSLLRMNIGTFDEIKNVQRLPVGELLSNADLDYHTRQAIAEYDAKPIGIDALTRAAERSKRDRNFENTEHRFIIFDNKIAATINHAMPYDGIKVHKILNEWQELADVEGYNHPKARMSWDLENGTVNAKVLYDKIELENADVNDEIGFGFNLRDGKFGTSAFSISPYTENVACTNGMISTKLLDSNYQLNVKHTSYKNMATKLGNWLFSTVDLQSNNAIRSNMNLTNDRRIIMKLKAGLLPDIHTNRFSEAEQYRFYPLIANALYDTMEASKLQQMEFMERAATIKIEDLNAEIDKYWAQNDMLSKSDREVFDQIWDQDDTLPSRSKATQYHLAQSFSRLANSSSYATEKQDRLQRLANEIMVGV